MSTEVQVLTNEVIEGELLLVRVETDRNMDTCYMHNVLNGAKVSIFEGQPFVIGESTFLLNSVMDDYAIIQPEDTVLGPDEFVINQDIYSKGDLIITKLDYTKGICYCHSVASGAKVSFKTGQRVVIGGEVYILNFVTKTSAHFEPGH